MLKKSFNKAVFSLSNARRAIEAYEKAGTINLQRAGWWQFLNASSDVFVQLENGARAANGRSKGWFDNVKAERASDELLSYLLHARNCDHHGIHETSEPRGAFKQLGPMFGIHYPATDDTSVDPALANPEGMEGASFYIGMPMFNDMGRMHIGPSALPPRLTLIPVIDRSVTYPTPTTHLDVEIGDGTDPLAVAKLGYTYMHQLVGIAEEFIVTSRSPQP